MPLKSILVHDDDVAASRPRLDAAIRVARDFQAELVGPYLVPPIELHSTVAVMIPPDVIERRQRNLPGYLLAEELVSTVLLASGHPMRVVPYIGAPYRRIRRAIRVRARRSSSSRLRRRAQRSPCSRSPQARGGPARSERA